MVEAFGFRIYDFGFRVYNVRRAYRVNDMAFSVFTIRDFRLRLQDLRLLGLRCTV